MLSGALNSLQMRGVVLTYLLTRPEKAQIGGNKKTPQPLRGLIFVWCARQESNLRHEV